MISLPISELPFDFSSNLDFDNDRVHRGPLYCELKSFVNNPDFISSYEVLEALIDAIGLDFFGRDRCKVELKTVNNGRDSLLKLATSNFPSDGIAVLLSLWTQTRFSGDQISSVSIFRKESTAIERSVVIPLRVEQSEPIQYLETYQHPELELDISCGTEFNVAQVNLIDHVCELWGFLDALGGFDFNLKPQEHFAPDYGDLVHLTPKMLKYTNSRLSGCTVALQYLLNGISCQMLESGLGTPNFRITLY